MAGERVWRYQRQVTSIGTVSFDVGYVASDTLTTVSSYHGTYFDCIYAYRLSHGLRISYSYRGYVGDTGGPTSVAMWPCFQLHGRLGQAIFFSKDDSIESLRNHEQESMHQRNSPISAKQLNRSF